MKWTGGSFSNFNPISSFLGREEVHKQQLSFGLDGKKLKDVAATVVVPPVNGLESQLGARGSERNYISAGSCFRRQPTNCPVHKLQKDLPGEAACTDLSNCC